MAALTPPAAIPPVTVAVVSWNTRELLLRCLTSLRADVLAGRARVVVVDNGSRDGSAAAARDCAPWAEVMDLGENVGFGRAVNLVAAVSDGEWLAAANADIELRPGALEALIAAGARPGVGAVAPRLVLPDGETQHSVGPLPGIALAVVFSFGLYRCSTRLADRLCLEGHWDAERERSVPWAIAAFLLLRRRAFNAVGGFDERQWMYAEDLDLGWRLRDAGWITHYVPRARVAHASGSATALAFGDRRRQRYMRATYAVIARRRGPGRARATATINALGAVLRAAWMAPPALVSEHWRGRRRDALDWAAAHAEGLRRLAADDGAPER